MKFCFMFPGVKGDPGLRGVDGDKGMKGERGEKAVKGNKGDIGEILHCAICNTNIHNLYFVHFGHMI